MSDMSVNKLLDQMRALREQGVVPKQNTNPADLAKASDTVNFGDLLEKAVDTVNDLQQDSSGIKKAYALGESDVNLAEVMIAGQKASLAFQSMVQVRNKLVEAYREVMNMPI